MPFFYHELTPMIFMIATFAFAAVVVIAIIAGSVIKHKRETEAYKTAIEKGLTPDQINLGTRPEAALRSGLVWIAVGAGLFVVILAAGGSRSLAVSAIPVLIGIALIISYRLEKR